MSLNRSPSDDKGMVLGITEPPWPRMDLRRSETIEHRIEKWLVSCIFDPETKTLHLLADLVEKAVPQHSSFRMAKYKFERGRSCEEIPWPCPNPEKKWYFISVPCSIFMETKWGETWFGMDLWVHPETQKITWLLRMSSVSQCQLWIAHRNMVWYGNSLDSFGVTVTVSESFMLKSHGARWAPQMISVGLYTI